MVEPSILLLGTGYTLGRLAQLLSRSQIVLTSRDAERCTKWCADGFIARRCDLAAGVGLEELLREFSSISQVIDSVPPLRESADPANGVRYVCETFRNSALKRLIYLSTTGVYGRGDGGWVDESSVVEPTTLRGRARLACEQTYRSGLIGPALSVLRLPAIYGPGRGVGHALRAGRYRLIDDGGRWSNRVHVDDLVGILRSCLDYDIVQRLPEIMCVADHMPTLQREIAQYYCDTFGLDFPQTISSDVARELGYATMLSNQRVRNDLLLSTLGYELQYPSFKEGAITEFAEK